MNTVIPTISADRSSTASTNEKLIFSLRYAVT